MWLRLFHWQTSSKTLKIWPAKHLAITYLINYFLSSDKSNFLILLSIFLLLNIFLSVNSSTHKPLLHISKLLPSCYKWMFSIVIWSERHKISNAATESVLLCWAFLWFLLSNSFIPKEYGSYIFSKLLVSVQKENTFFNPSTDLPFLVTKKNTLNHKRHIKNLSILQFLLMICWMLWN